MALGGALNLNSCSSRQGAINFSVVVKEGEAFVEITNAKGVQMVKADEMN